MNQINIYVLKHPITNEIRYVGKTKASLKKRLSQHISNVKYEKKNHRKFWIESLLKESLVPTIQLLESCDENNWKEREIYWIKHLKEQNYRLVNMTDGGETASNNISLIMKNTWKNQEYREKHSGENHHMKKIENKLKVTGKNNGMFGKRHSTEALKKISESRKKQVITEHTRKKISLALSNKPKSESHKKNLSLSIKKLNKKQIELIFYLREKGLSLTQIANKIGNISYASISRILNRKLQYMK